MRSQLAAPWRATLLYLVLGAAWILFSDVLVGSMSSDIDALQHLQTFKGWAFVLITGLILYLVLRSNNSKQHKMIQALHEREEEYRYLFESNPHPMWVYDPEAGTFLAVNTAAIRQYGYAREQFLQLTMKDLQAEDASSVPQEDVPGKHSPLNYAGRWRHRKKNGTTISVDIMSHELLFGGRLAHRAHNAD